MSISAVPIIFIFTNAALQCISRKTSYHGVRLAFHSFSQVIRALCNVQLFGPISLLMKRSPRFGSNTTDLTHSYWIVAFARAIHLASNNKLLTHYAKGTLVLSTNCYSIFNFKVYFTPFYRFFSSFPRGTKLHYRSKKVFRFRRVVLLSSNRRSDPFYSLL